MKIQQVAEDLGVRYVLEGSVHKSGDRLRITAQLIDATTGHHLWAEKYDRDLTDIFAVRDEVTLKIVTALQVKLTEGEWLNAWGAKTDNLEVFVKAKQALEHFRRFNPDDNILARQKAEEALALDPNYAPAMEVLGLALIFDTRWGTSKAPEKSMEKALELAQKLLDRGDYDAHAHLLFGLAYRNKGQFEKAVAELELARAKAPNDAEINALLGAVLNVAERREEAINVLENAMRLNPFPPNWYIMVLGDAYLLTRQYEKAVAAYKKVIHIQPDNFFAHLTLAASYIYLEQTENARAEAAEVLRINPKYIKRINAESRNTILRFCLLLGNVCFSEIQLTWLKGELNHDQIPTLASQK